MYLRKKLEDKEVIINTSLIWKIEIAYSETANGNDWSVSAATGIADPSKTKWYRIFIGNEILVARASSGGLAQVAEDIDKSAT
jgi:hypothetical protein